MSGRMLWAAAVAGLAASLVACGSDGPNGARSTTAPSTSTTFARTITGILVLTYISSTPIPAGLPCHGMGGYSDISEGAQVTVKDQASALVAVSRLGPGVSVAGGGVARTNCQFSFTVGPIPDRPFYQIEVASRKGISYPKQDLEARGWRVELSLGS